MLDVARCQQDREKGFGMEKILKLALLDVASRFIEVKLDISAPLSRLHILNSRRYYETVPSRSMRE